MQIILLPGLDGTGELFIPLIKELPTSVTSKIIKYDVHKEQSYDELIEYVIEQLPSEPFILVAESFSGFIAYNIGLKKPKYLKHIIFVATFLKNPRPKIWYIFANRYIFSLKIPQVLIKVLFLGFSVKNNVINLFQESIYSVSSKVLYFRLMQVKNLSFSKEILTLKTTYIQAKNDKLVPKYALNDFTNICEDLNIFKIKANHLILQAEPKKCSEIPNNEIEK